MTSMDGRRGSRADELLAGWTEVAGRARRPAEAPTGSMVGGLGVLVRFVMPAAFALVVVLAVGLLLPGSGSGDLRMGAGTSPAASPGQRDACPVTVPNGAHGGAWPETPLDHGAEGIFTALAPDGAIEVVPDGNGVLWRDMLFSLADPAVGPLVVTGRRWSVEYAEITASPGILSETVIAEYPDGDDGEGVLRVDLGFPGEGCWEIVATAGSSQLRYVTRVVRSTDRWLEECQVTRPNEAHTEAWPASALDIGEGGLFTVLWPDGTVVIPRDGVDADGVGWMKFVFQREGAAEGELRIGGRRVGAEPSDPLGVVRADIPDGYGTAGVQAASIGFPTEGCWEVIARSGTSQLRFVTRVVFERSAADLVGSVAPRLMLGRAGGGHAAIPVAAGRPTVITFLASWCPPCSDEALAVAGITASDVDRVLVAVEDDPVAVAEAFGSLPFTVLLDPDGSAFAAYQGFGLPLTVFIDGGGSIRSVVHGPLDEASITAGLDAIEPVALFYSGASGSPIPVWAEPAPSPGN